MEDKERPSLSNGAKQEEEATAQPQGAEQTQQLPESSTPPAVMDLLDLGGVEHAPSPSKDTFDAFASNAAIADENGEASEQPSSSGPPASSQPAAENIILTNHTTDSTDAPSATAAATTADSLASITSKPHASVKEANVNGSVVKPRESMQEKEPVIATSASTASTPPQEQIMQHEKSVTEPANNGPRNATTQLSNPHLQQASNDTQKSTTVQEGPTDTDELQRTKAINVELERQNRTLRDQLKKVQQQFERQLAARGQAEQSSSQAHDTIRQLRSELETTNESLKTSQTQTTTARQRQAQLEQDLQQLRVEYDEHQQLKMSLEVRLNEIRKVEAAEANLVEQYEEDLKAAFGDLEATREELERLKRDHANLLQQHNFAEQRVEETKSHFEALLEDEKKKNEMRKAKMKTFVDKKTEELRQSKEECENLQNEIAQTNHSLLDMDKRWKQLHSQWTQAQTRNRELQRDLNRIKKDSENLHKQGDTLEMKLSRSANETEEHKNKRLAAKHELMSVLRTLDAERDSTARLCQRVKFSVAPRILELQQLLDESSTGLDGALHRLALRSGKPVAASQSDSVHEHDERNRENGSNSDATPLQVEGASNTELLATIEKLDDETRRVSRVTASVAEQVERLRSLVDSTGDRSCFTVLSELVSTGSIASSPAALQNHAHTISNVLPAIRGRTQGYGQVPHASDHP